MNNQAHLNFSILQPLTPKLRMRRLDLKTMQKCSSEASKKLIFVKISHYRRQNDRTQKSVKLKSMKPSHGTRIRVCDAVEDQSARRSVKAEFARR